MVDLSLTLAGLRFRNPVLSASGTYGHGLEMRHMSDPARLGGLVSKSVSLRPRAGNPAPRIRETEAGFLNSIGLENRGVEHYLEHVLPEVAGADTNVVTNIVGEDSAEEYAELARILDEQPAVAALEVNLSCPNVAHKSVLPSLDHERVAALVSAARAATSKWICAKLPPYSCIDAAPICEEAGAQALCISNTFPAIAYTPGGDRITGGLSGPAIKPMVLYNVFHCARRVSIPIVASGGVQRARDVREFLDVGARAVQVGSVSFVFPDAVIRILDELEKDPA